MFPAGIDVTVRRSGGYDPNGDPLPGSEHQLLGCGFDPGGSVEVTAAGDRITTEPHLYCDFDADVLGTDTILLPGDPVAWYVDGDPARWHNPITGLDAGCVVKLTRTRG